MKEIKRGIPSSYQEGISVYTLRPIQNGRHFPDDIFKLIFLYENGCVFILISFKFVPTCPIDYNPALVQIMAWRRPGDKPLSEPMIVRLPTHMRHSPSVSWKLISRENIFARHEYVSRKPMPNPDVGFPPMNNKLSSEWSRIFFMLKNENAQQTRRRLWVSTYNLLIHTFPVYQSIWDERICKFCSLREIDDEINFLVKSICHEHIPVIGHVHISRVTIRWLINVILKPTWVPRMKFVAGNRQLCTYWRDRN